MAGNSTDYCMFCGEAVVAGDGHASCGTCGAAACKECTQSGWTTCATCNVVMGAAAAKPAAAPPPPTPSSTTPTTPTPSRSTATPSPAPPFNTSSSSPRPSPAPPPPPDTAASAASAPTPPAPKVHTVGPSRRLAAKATFGCFLAAAVLGPILLGIGIFQVARGQPPVAPSTADVLQPTSGNTQQTLADAITQTPDGGTLQLAAGTFDLGTDQLRITKSVRLVGDGEGSTKIAGQADGAVVIASGNIDFSADGISFARTGGDGSALVLACRKATIARCLFTGSAGADRWWQGSLWIRGTTIATVRQSRASNGLGGIGVDGRSRVTLSNNVCTKNQDGIIVSGRATAVVSNNSCSVNLNSGILFRNHAGGVARSNRCSHNKWGLAVANRAHPRLRGNLCKKNSVANVNDYRRK